MRVYFFRCVGHPHLIKIGCSRMPVDRLFHIAQISPVRLEIAASTPGTHADERHLHKIFAADRAHFEWFRPSPGLNDLIESLSAGAALVDLIGPSPLNMREKWRLRHRPAELRGAA